MRWLLDWIGWPSILLLVIVVVDGIRIILHHHHDAAGLVVVGVVASSCCRCFSVDLVLFRWDGFIIRFLLALGFLKGSGRNYLLWQNSIGCVIVQVIFIISHCLIVWSNVATFILAHVLSWRSHLLYLRGVYLKWSVVTLLLSMWRIRGTSCTNLRWRKDLLLFENWWGVQATVVIWHCHPELMLCFLKYSLVYLTNCLDCLLLL